MEDPFTLLAVIAGSFLAATAALSLVRGAQCSFSPSRLEALLPSPRERARLEAYLADQGRRRAVIDLLGTIAQFAYVLFAHLAFRTWYPEAGFFGYVLFVSLAIGLLFFLGRLLPRRVGTHRSESVMARSLGSIEVIVRGVGGLARPFVFLTDLALRALGASGPDSASGDEEDLILSTVADKEREGLIREGEKDMIAGVIELKDADVSEVMTPRTDVVMVELGLPVPEAIKVAVDCGYSRLPVFSESQDNVVGILYVKDLLQYWGTDEAGNVKLEAIMRRPFFVPETKHIGELLREFQAMKVHIAIVLDEYGGTAGLVTIEDIIEEIVGEIADEYDPIRENRMRVVGKSQADVDARVHIDDLNEALSIELPEGNGFETVGGFIVHTLGRIPTTGESVDWEGVRFTVTEADERRIHRVMVRLGREENGSAP